MRALCNRFTGVEPKPFDLCFAMRTREGDTGWVHRHRIGAKEDLSAVSFSDGLLAAFAFEFFFHGSSTHLNFESGEARL